MSIRACFFSKGDLFEARNEPKSPNRTAGSSWLSPRLKLLQCALTCSSFDLLCNSWRIFKTSFDSKVWQIACSNSLRHRFACPFDDGVSGLFFSRLSLLSSFVPIPYWSCLPLQCCGVLPFFSLNTSQSLYFWFLMSACLALLDLPAFSSVVDFVSCKRLYKNLGYCKLCCIWFLPSCIPSTQSTFLFLGGTLWPFHSTLCRYSFVHCHHAKAFCLLNYY